MCVTNNINEQLLEFENKRLTKEECVDLFSKRFDNNVDRIYNVFEEIIPEIFLKRIINTKDIFQKELNRINSFLSQGKSNEEYFFFILKHENGDYGEIRESIKKEDVKKLITLDREDFLRFISNRDKISKIIDSDTKEDYPLKQAKKLWDEMKIFEEVKNLLNKRFEESIFRKMEKRNSEEIEENKKIGVSKGDEKKSIKNYEQFIKLYHHKISQKMFNLIDLCRNLDSMIYHELKNKDILTINIESMGIRYETKENIYFHFEKLEKEYQPSLWDDYYKSSVSFLDDLKDVQKNILIFCFRCIKAVVIEKKQLYFLFKIEKKGNCVFL